MRMLQVCNVGQITGGTAACAWTIARSLPEMEHVVAFRGAPTAETRAAFAGAEVCTWEQITADFVRRRRADVVVLHNTAAGRVKGALPAVTVAYVHSRITPPTADLVVYCSRWLAEQCGGAAEAVLSQPVPAPPGQENCLDTRALREQPVVGRLCTPTRRKWPDALPRFYAPLAEEHPEVLWEFVGCPESLRGALADACGGRARFAEAGWTARQRLWHWDAMLYHHPTLTESFGRTVAESLRAGCIPLVDRRGGFVEQLSSGGGRLCESVAQFSAAVGDLRDRGKTRQLSRAARVRGDEAFSLRRFREEFLSRLRTLVGAAVG